LSKINNELEKLQIILPIGSLITPKDIEENIGFSKDFNVFELRKAIGERNQLKAYTIAENFANNPKENPMVVTTSLVLVFYPIATMDLKTKSEKCRSSYWSFLKEYDVALKNYPMKR
jgi:DNA polymerase-3 subunit delta